MILQRRHPSNRLPTRRQFLAVSGQAAGAAILAPLLWTSRPARAESKNDRHLIAAIGTGHRAGCINERAKQFGDIVAICDVDRAHADAFAHNWCEPGKHDVYSDYRRVLDRADVEAVVIAIGERWHPAVAIAALRAGKDVYLEKPASLTIDEGKKLRAVVKQTGRVLQVGTQQRSEFNAAFLQAVALARSGRLGKKLTATCLLHPNPAAGPFQTSPPPDTLDWDLWTGPVPKAPYSAERQKDPKFWYESGGGHVTDLGAHHVDIAQWALGAENTGPIEIEATGTPQTIEGGYGTHVSYSGTLTFAGGSQIVIKSEPGVFDILIAGDNGRIKVNRGPFVGGLWRDGHVELGKLSGAPVDALTVADWEWLADEVTTLYRHMPAIGRPGGLHMGNFFHCLRHRLTPISDIDTHHRSLTSCHLFNLALRLGRRLRWDPDKEEFVGDDLANTMLTRPRRPGFELDA